MFRKLISPFGRLSRGGMWIWGVLIPMLIGSAALYFDLRLAGWPDVDFQRASGPLQTTYSDAFQIAYLWPSFALSIKRFHDLGISGWVYIVLSIIYLASMFLFFAIVLGTFPYEFIGDESALELAQQAPNWFGWPSGSVVVVSGLTLFWLTLVLPGQSGPNRYGEDPLYG